MVEELNLTIPQTLVCIAIATLLLIVTLKSVKNTTVEIELPEVDEEPQKQEWNPNIGAVLQNASEYH